MARPRKGSSLGTEGDAAVRLGVASAGEVGLERMRARAQTNKGKARRQAPVLGDQKLGRAARERACARVVKGECTRVLPGRTWDRAKRLCSAATHAGVHARPACRRSRRHTGKTQGGTAGCTRVDEGCGTCKKRFSQPGSMAGITQLVCAQGSTRDLDSKVGRHKSWGEMRCSPTAKKGPDGEGVGVEGLNAVAAWCSETEEGRRRARRLGPAPASRTAPARRRRRAPTDDQPRLLLLHTSYVSGGGLGKGKP
jgi:hypothetical protein